MTSQPKKTASAAGSRPYEINVIDNCLPEVLTKQVQDFVLQAPWHYGWKSDAKRDLYSFWHIHLAGSLQGPDMDKPETVTYCEDDLAKASHFAPIHAMWQHLNKHHLPRHRVIRAYLNAHTFGTEGSIHTDTRYPNQYTVIYYASPMWSTDWAGETVFFNHDRSDIVAAVHPKPGRLCFFDGRIPHTARSLTRSCPALRTVVVFKTELAADTKPLH